MEIIKKRISLEQFKSRIPSILDTFNLNKTPHDGSWGEIPHRVSLMGKYMKYGTMMNLYYRLIKLLMKLEFKQYDSLGTKWLDIKCDWRDLLDSSNNLRQKLRIVQELPESIDATLIVSIISETDYTLFFDEVRAALGNDDYDGIDYIVEVHRIVGRIVVPKTITGVFVPYMIWITDIPDIIVFMKALKLEADNNCCYIEKYKAYGGDDFLEFLEGYEVPVKPTKKCPYCEWTTDEIPNRTNAFEKHLFDEHNKTLEDYLKEHEEDRDYFPLLSIDIPILLTANLIDLGLTKTDDISEELTINVNTGVTLTPKIVTGVNGESKLLTLRRRKRSIDDNGVELPFIYKPLFNESGTIIDETTETPFKEGYIKNVQMFNNKYYGDVIASMEEIEAEDETLTIQITYAIGARLKKIGEVLTLDETSPYRLTQEQIDTNDWDGEGIWYTENYPFYKDLIWSSPIDGVFKTLTYDYIDIKSKMITYEPKNIDFPRNNYILSTDIRYKSSVYYQDGHPLDTPSFYDEKMIGLPEKFIEEYDVLIDRGSSAAFERHLVLSEIETFQDLELFRNNMFNI